MKSCVMWCDNMICVPNDRVQPPSRNDLAQSHRPVQGEEVEVFPRINKLQCARFQPEGIARNGLGRSVSAQSSQLSCFLAVCDEA